MLWFTPGNSYSTMVYSNAIDMGMSFFPRLRRRLLEHKLDPTPWIDHTLDTSSVSELDTPAFFVSISRTIEIPRTVDFFRTLVTLRVVGFSYWLVNCKPIDWLVDTRMRSVELDLLLQYIRIVPLL